MRVPQFVAVTWLILLWASGASQAAEKRVALVIGNDRYANLPSGEQLQKAVNDARAVGKALEQLGFEVMSGENADRTALVDKLDAFTRRLGQGDTAFFFFSGHGVALGGANYILPADVPNVEAEQESRLARFALSEHDIVSDLQARGVRVAVVVLDACRTNPFARPGSKGVGGERGLAPPPQVRGVFSLYAASSGQAARDRLSDDDRNPNSVFSRVLVPALAKPGLDLTALAFDVREEVARVARSAGYIQEPSYYDGTIGGRVYLNGAPSAGVADAAPVWEAIKNTTDLAVLDDYIRQFGDVPIYGPLARARREQAGRLAVAVDPASDNTGRAGTKATDFQTAAPSAILIEAESGAVLYEKGADAAMPPSSMAKLMTVEVVLNEIRHGRIKTDDEFTVSEDAWRRGGAPSHTSSMFIPIHSRVRVDDLLRGAIVMSGNDACITLAEGIAGDEASFVTMMNNRAHELRLTMSYFTNATGLPDPAQKATVRDLAGLARHIIHVYPDYYKIFGEREFAWNKIRQHNRDPLLTMNIGADGLMTGYSNDDGYGLVGSTVQNGTRLIVAVNGLKTAKERADDVRKMIEFGYRSLEAKTLFEAGQARDPGRR